MTSHKSELEKNTKCDQCAYEALDVKDLVEHILANHEKNMEMIECQYCEYRAVNLLSMNDHIEADHQEYAILRHLAKCQVNAADAFENFKVELTNVLNNIIDGHNTIKQELFIFFWSKKIIL